MWQMVGVFALMNICQIAVLFKRLPAQVMSADGSWSFALMNII
jgi:hypothetical protein